MISGKIWLPSEYSRWATVFLRKKWKIPNLSELPLWSVTENNVEPTSNFADLGSGNVLEVNFHRSLHLRVAKAFKDKVLGVSRITFDVALSREFLMSSRFYCDVNVRSSSWLGLGLDRTKIIFTSRTG